MIILSANNNDSGFLLPRVESESLIIDSIEAYIKTYLYENFDRVYSEFDQGTEYLVEYHPDNLKYLRKGANIEKKADENPPYES
jgi:hypothetical protein